MTWVFLSLTRFYFSVPYALFIGKDKDKKAVLLISVSERRTL